MCDTKSRRLPESLVVTFAFVWVAAVCMARAQGTSFIIDGVSTNAGTAFHVGDTDPSSFLLITNGGALNNQTGIIGNAESSTNNTAYVSGAGSRWTSSVEFMLGNSGAANHLEVSDGGRIEQAGSGGTFMGYHPTSSNNAARVTRNGVLSASGRIYVGYSGAANEFVVDYGGSIINLGLGSSTRIGYNASSSNNLIRVAGANSTWRANALILGDSGRNNRLLIYDQGLLSAGSCFIGYLVGAENNLAEVRGPGSRLDLSSMVVGFYGVSNHLVVLDGGVVNVRNDVTISGARSAGAGGSNSVIVDGNGSVLTSATLLVGFSGPDNTLTIRNGGTVRASLFFVSSSNSIVWISDGRMLAATNAAQGGLIQIDDGSLILSGGVVIADRLTVNGPQARVSLNAGRLTIKSSTAFYPGSPLVVGDGTNSAFLELVEGTHYLLGGLHVARNASLGGDGMITGSVTNSGTIAPGASAGVLTINGTLTLEDVGNLHLEIGGTSQAVDFDFISVSNTVHFAGRLQISLINEFTPTGTDTFPILRFVSATGTFANAPNGGRVKTANRLGSFRVNYEAQTVTLTDYQSTDVDADGIEDAWALQHFGHSPLSAAERQADADSDGLSNYGEFVAGTDPTLAASVFKVLSVKTANNGAVILQFSGNDETTYRIWRSEDLITWMEASAQNFVTRAAGLHEWTGNTVSLSGPGFYRVSVE